MDSLERLVDGCARCLSRFDSITADRAVLAAVSGGVDSTVLLFALVRLRAQGRLPGELHAAHIDHGVRADSRRNAAHVVALCERLGVPIHVRRLDLAGARPSEQRLREARYSALDDVARTVDAGLLVAAHHADDNLETVLFRLLRGTGPRGLAGIPEARWLGTGARRLLLVRPLLRTRRSTLEAILRSLGEQAYEDSSNADLRYARNLIRHETMPALRRALGPGLEVALLTVASTARAVDEILTAQANRILAQRTNRKTAWRLELDLRDLGDDDAPFVAEALRQAHVALHPHGGAPSTAWLARATSLLRQPGGTRLAGRGGLLVERIRDGLLLADTERAGPPPRTHDGGQLLHIDHDRQRFGATEWLLRAHSHPLPPLHPAPAASGPYRALLDPRAAPGPWRLRTRRAGDRFQPLGLPYPVELRRFLQARHLPRFDRDRVPLVVDEQDRVLWVPGVEVSELARLRLNTRHCIELQAAIG